MVDDILKNYIHEINESLSQIYKSDFSFRDKYVYLWKSLENVATELTNKETIQFPYLFSKIVFLAQKYKLPKKLEYELQQIRVVGNKLRNNKQYDLKDSQFHYSYNLFTTFLNYVSGKITDLVSEESFRVDNSLASTVPEKLRIQVTYIDFEKYCFTGVSVAESSEEYVIQLGIDSINQVFEETFKQLWIGAQLNLIDCKRNEAGSLIPSLLVLEPDYLIDASAISECFQNFAQSPLMYILRKIEPYSASEHILLGNLANFILDELINSDDPQKLNFRDIFLKSFRQMPFEYSVCKEIQTSETFTLFMNKAENQFENIKRVVLNDLQQSGFQREKCILEPSFYSEKYGFQGRLDLLELDNKDQLTRILELKSGKTPWPQTDTSKVAVNHIVQISVYRMMIESVFNLDFRNIHTLLLYSAADKVGENLRLSAPPLSFYKEILNLRNQIVAQEHRLYTSNIIDLDKLFEELFCADNYGSRVPDFFIDKLNKVKEIYTRSSPLERTYFLRFVIFVSRELYIMKLEDSEGDKSMSLAALWNTSFDERKRNLELISDLTIRSINEESIGMNIVFEKPSHNDSVNFREGEICVLYPRKTDQDNILSNQILKGTIVQIAVDFITVKFRFKQRFREYFDNNQFWVIEHDKLDHGFNAMFKSLFAFLKSPQIKKDILLGLSEPRAVAMNYTPDQSQSEDEIHKQKVITKALLAEDYFLIVGPPGTGKTSVFAKTLIERIYAETTDSVLVMAYTNRAVDELCASIVEATRQHSGNSFIRIGSQHTCASEYRNHLLQNMAEECNNRKQLVERLTNTRIFVGTLASIVGKPELMEFKRFRIAIIDEASQILEPQIIGLLPLFEKFIMIGDHKQLSTISQQSTNHSKVCEQALQNIELHDCRESMFERLYRLANQNGWTHAYDTLTYHGRMHEEIANLVNHDFYNGILQPLSLRQKEALTTNAQASSNNDLKQIISNNRNVFFHVANPYSISSKINEPEALLVAELVTNILDIYKERGKEFIADKTLGIITPYRNQIATIKALLSKMNVPVLANVMVDTVERYQGSQRDIIIVSFCFNNTFQLTSFSNMNKDNTVDRKLNVALTRAREQLFLIGNKDIMNRNTIYRTLLDKIKIQIVGR